MMHDAPVYLGDLWVWSTVDRKWTEVEAGTPAPSARYGHAMTVVGQQIFLYGGGQFSDFKRGETHEREHIPSGLCAELSLCVLSVEYFLTPCRL